jgi:hypothetical protein
MDEQKDKLYTFELIEVYRDDQDIELYGKAYQLTYGGRMIAKTHDSIEQAIAHLDAIRGQGGDGSYKVMTWGLIRVLVVVLHPPTLSGTDDLKMILDACVEETINLLALNAVELAGIEGVFSVN